jgi:hypothetical protein
MITLNQDITLSRATGRMICGMLFLTLWFCYSFAHQVHYDRATSYSRLSLLHALFVEKSGSSEKFAPERIICWNDGSYDRRTVKECVRSS